MNLGSAWLGVEELYNRSPLADVKIHATLFNAEYERWRRAARRVFRLVDTDRPFWQTLAAESGRLSFVIHNSPLDPNHPLAEKWLSQKLLEATYQQTLSQELREAIDGFWAARSILKSCASSPFIDWLTEQHQGYIGGKRCALLVAKKDWVQPTRATLRKNVALRSIDVFDTSSLSEPIAFERLYVCGAVVLFPSSLYTCSRAEEIEWALFDWMKSLLPTREPGLTLSTRPNAHSHVLRRPAEFPSAEPVADELDSTGIWTVSEVLPEPRESNDVSGLLDTVLAVELLLVDGSRTFAPVLENVSIATAVDSWTPGSIWLGRKLGKDLSRDDFVIVRTYGESDVILDLANKILGPRATELRSMQAEWKAALLEQRRRMTMDQLIQALRAAGSVIADHQNVRNWLSSRHIRTQNRDDFIAILRVAGLGDRADFFWERMGIIGRAHIRAGMQLKAKLTAALRKHSGSELLAAGRLDVAYVGLDAGSLTAIRVDQIGEQKEVRDMNLLRLIEPWHG